MSKEEFEQLYPEDEYKDENNMYKWEKGEKVYEKNFNNILIATSHFESLNCANSRKEQLNTSFDLLNLSLSIKTVHFSMLFNMEKMTV